MMQFEYFNARLLQNTALKIKETVGAVTPPAGYAFGVLSALTNLEITNSDLVENVNSVYVNTLDIKIPTEETMVEYIEYVFEHDAAKRDSVIIKSNTIPAASDELVGYEYQYMGKTNNTYTHGFVYVCKAIPTDTLVFTPDTVSCDWANLSAFLQTETADYNSVVAGSMTYFADAELWRATFTDANGDTVLTYQQSTGDWENVGFVFSGTFEDGDVVSFVRYTESDYVWERVDLQPNHEQDVAELQADVAEIQSVIPAQASASNQLADKNYVQSGLDEKQNTISDLAAIRSNAQAGKTASDTIATYGNIVTHNVAEFATAAQGAKADTAVQPSDLGNGTITITQGGITKGTFTTNQSGDTTVALDAGGGGIGNIDNLTITANADDEIQTVATINANTATGATNPIYDWVGTLAEYKAQNIETLHPDWVCFITDDLSAEAYEAYTKGETLNLFVQKGHQVVEFQEPTAQNGYTWYRKYADGWVEQGGLQTSSSGSSGVTVTLPVAMTDANYTIVATISEQDYFVTCLSKTTTSFQFRSVNFRGEGYNKAGSWQVSGMAA